jgi:hypothetical protein
VWGAVGSAPERKGAICVRCLEVLYLLKFPSPRPGSIGLASSTASEGGELAQEVVGSDRLRRVWTGSGGFGQVVACPRSPLLVLTLQFVPEIPTPAHHRSTHTSDRRAGYPLAL